MSVCNYITLFACLINFPDCSLQLVRLQRSLLLKPLEEKLFGDYGAVRWELTVGRGVRVHIHICMHTHTQIHTHKYACIFAPHIHTHVFCIPLPGRVEFEIGRNPCEYGSADPLQVFYNYSQIFAIHSGKFPKTPMECMHPLHSLTFTGV